MTDPTKPRCPLCGSTNIIIIGKKGKCGYCYLEWKVVKEVK